jgi:electron transport complex protein RnfD
VETKLLRVSSSPHFRSDERTDRIMMRVIVALVPAIIGGIVFFGRRALVVLFASTLGAVLAEMLMLHMRRRQATAADMNSAVVTGILMAFCCTSEIPWWMAFLGSVFGVAIAKHCFGGLGYNIFNPALAGRIFLMAAYPQDMTTWASHFRAEGVVNVDAVTSATNLGLVKEFPLARIPDYWDRIWDLFLGNCGGCIGETSVMLLLIGAIFLLWKKTISWHIPISYIATLALFTWIFGGKQSVDGKPVIAFFAGDPLFHIVAGGLILGAFFMATDMVTSPMTPKGMLIFGFGCGILTGVIRIFGGYPEGVSYAIFLMNTTVPLIDRYTKPKTFGADFGKEQQ